LELVRRLSEKAFGGLPYHRGPVLANRLGYQLVRTAYRHIDWYLRKQSIDPELGEQVTALDRDGCITIPSFLPAEQFRAVREEYDRSRRELTYDAPVVEPNNVVEERVDLGPHRQHFPHAWESLIENQKLRALVGAALHRRVNVRPRGWSNYWYRSEVPLGARGGDHVKGANNVHADMHYPTFKAFLYLSDTDESNGAFRFALGSHKLTVARLAYEYEASIRVAESRRNGTYATVPYAVIRAPSDEQSRAMNLDCTSINGKANTLILANTQGFHRQGEFEPGRVREAVLLCFRTSEPGGEILLT
jgi:hypothetical protein